ncbi:MAG: S41 family peptidase [Minisyncoccota bacterium]
MHYTIRRTQVGVFVVMMVCTYGIGYWAGNERATTQPRTPSFAIVGSSTTTYAVPAGIDLSPVWSVWNLIDEKFVPTASSTLPDARGRVEGMAQGLVESLGDPYSVYLPAAQSKFFQDEISGNFAGIGIEIGIDKKILTVIAPLKNTPAARAGVKAGDQIIAIDGASTFAMTMGEAMKHIRGEIGTTVVLSIVHKDSKEVVKIPVVRATIDIPTIKTIQRPDGVFVIQLYSFTATSPDLFRGALREFALSGDSKLILDLRDDPGGYLDAAVDMASWFLPAGSVVAREDFGTKAKEQVYRSRGYNIFTDKLKMAVLINNGSASASEILSGALSEHGKATLIGEKSYGKGSVQELIPFDSGASLKITVARWLTPNGRSISGVGLMPQIEVNDSRNTENSPDAQMERAATFLVTGS